MRTRPPMRIASGPVKARHRLVDHDHGLRVGGVGRRDEPPAHQPFAERLRRAIGHDLPIALGVLARWFGISLDVETEVADRVREWQGANGPRARHAGQRPHAREEAFVERDDLCGLGIAGRRHGDPRREHVRRIEPEIDALQRPETADHQHGADGEHDGKRDFDHDQEPAQAGPRRARGRLMRPFLERVVQVQPEGAHGRCGAEHERREDARQRGEGEDPPIHPDRVGTRHDRRIDGEEDPDAGDREQQPERPAGDGEHDALGQQLADQAPVPGAKRAPQRELAMAAFGAREDQARDVRAGDQQQKRHRAGEQPDRRPHRPEDLLVEPDRERGELHGGRIQALARPGGGERRQLGARARRRFARAQERCAEQPVIAARLRDLLDVECERQPELCRLRRILPVVGRQPESRRHDRDDGPRGAVDLNGAVQDAWITGIPRLPQPVAQNGDVVMARPVFERGERPTEKRRRAEDIEGVGRDRTGADTNGIAVAGQVGGARIPQAHARKRSDVPRVVEPFGAGQPRLIEPDPAAVDQHALLGLRVRQRLQQHGVHHGEDGADGADAERQGHERREGERRGSQQSARRAPGVGDEGLEAHVAPGGSGREAEGSQRLWAQRRAVADSNR